MAQDLLMKNGQSSHRSEGCHAGRPMDDERPWWRQAYGQTSVGAADRCGASGAAMALVRSSDARSDRRGDGWPPEWNRLRRCARGTHRHIRWQGNPRLEVGAPLLGSHCCLSRAAGDRKSCRERPSPREAGMPIRFVGLPSVVCLAVGIADAREVTGRPLRTSPRRSVHPPVTTSAWLSLGLGRRRRRANGYSVFNRGLRLGP